MIEINFSQKELDTIIAGLREREDRMFRDAQEYGKQGNKIAQMDCVQEWHLAEDIRKRLQSINK